MTLDNGLAIQDNSRADLNLEDSISVMVERQKPVLIVALCSVRQKFSLPYAALLTSNRATTKAGFFISAASAAIDNVPNWASCTGYIGWILPRSASLAALIKRLHNLFSISGRIAKLWSELIHSAHLALSGIKGYCGAGSIVYLNAP